MRRRQSEHYEFSALATYNSEKARGIVHTDEWKAKMVTDQARFDAQFMEKAEREGWIVIGREEKA